MIIPINDEYQIASDSRCWMIRRRVRRKGKVTWEPYKWYATVESCVNGLGQQMVRDSKADNVVDAVRDVERVCSELSMALAPHFDVRPKAAAND